MFQNWLHHLKCFILILINCPFNWVEREKDGKRKNRECKNKIFSFFVVAWKIGCVIFSGSKNHLPKSGEKVGKKCFLHLIYNFVHFSWELKDGK